MEPPPPPPAVSVPPESNDSSPRSRTTDVNWDDLPPPPGTTAKLRLMCSYGGHILPRPHDKALCYMGGDTRIVVVDRNSSLSSLLARLSTILLNGRPFTLKYQLPSEDLDSLISVTTDEDLENMIEEYDRTTAKSSRLRLYLFTPRPESTQSMGQILENSSKSDQWFLDCLNNNPSLLNRGYSDSDTNVNRLLGLDDCLAPTTQCTNSNGEDGGSSVQSAKQQQEQPPPLQQGGQDVPESPMLDTSSSFGSTTSSPSLANLPPIRVHVEDSARAQDQRLGIEEQFARINAAMSSPPPLPVTIALPAAPVTAAANEFQTRVFSDDERSDHGLPAGHRKPPTPRSQPQPQVQTHQLKSNNSGHDLPSPNSVSSDSSLNNPMFQQRVPSSVYQEPVAHRPSPTTLLTGLINPADPNTFLPKSQNQDQAYTLQPQFEQQSQPQQQPQFIHAAAPQYIHHHPSPVPTYIQVYPSQQPQHQHSFSRHSGQLDQQTYPVYYVTSPVPPRPHVMPVPHSPSLTEPPVSTMMPPTPSNHMRSVQPEMGQTAVYTTTTGAQMVHQIPSSQPQFMAYSQIHHPPQSGSAVNPNYAYEYADNAPKQIYYTQPMGYQTMTAPPPAMVMPDGSATPKLPAENMTQQIRSSQPL